MAPVDVEMEAEAETRGEAGLEPGMAVVEVRGATNPYSAENHPVTLEQLLSSLRAESAWRAPRTPSSGTLATVE